MNKWYQTIIVNHKEENGKTTHLLDDENYKILCKERAEQLKEIERLHNIIKEVRELVENGTDFKCITFRKVDEDTWKLILASHIKEEFLEILDKGNKDGER